MLKFNFVALGLLLAGATCTGAFAQGHQKESAETGRTITYDMLVSQYNFPVKKNTGNPEMDQKAYAAAKGKWIEANRGLYRRYNEQGMKANPESRKVAQPSFSPSK